MMSVQDSETKPSTSSRNLKMTAKKLSHTRVITKLLGSTGGAGRRREFSWRRHGSTMNSMSSIQASETKPSTSSGEIKTKPCTSVHDFVFNLTIRASDCEALDPVHKPVSA